MAVYFQAKELPERLEVALEAMAVEVSPTLRSFAGGLRYGKDQMVTGYRMTAFGEYQDDDTASTEQARQYKSETDLVVLNDQGGAQMNITNNVSGTLRSQEHGHQPVINAPCVGVRRLTPTECARLQGFPDGWNSWQDDSSRYKQYGNAVTVNVLEWIGKRIMETI